MAKVTIVLTDRPDGKVEVKMTPSYEQLARGINAGLGSTSAEGAAMSAARHMIELFYDKDPKDKGNVIIRLPKASRL